MVFNSLNFLLFFPIVCLLYYLVPIKYRYVYLFVASYVYYICWNPKYIVFLVISTVITYFAAIAIGKCRQIEDEKKQIRYKKWIIAFSFISNLAILGYFKYFNFAIDAINSVLEIVHIQPLAGELDLLLPLGISFYTFKVLSYTMDVYRDDYPVEKNFIKYALYVSFFPQLIAGPIERSRTLLKQINETHSVALRQICIGFTQMLYGYFQKVVVADNIAVIVNTIYDNHQEYGAIELIYATVLFAFQIYCDFGGCSNLAIGAANILGFDLMENFNAPYLATSVSDFWRRWHISLSTWFRDYLYIPLGGNRKGRLRKYMNLMIVFLVSGLWHGANWTFVIWGGLNGLYQIIGDLIKPVRERILSLCGVKTDTFAHTVVRMFITFVLICISWIFFNADSVGQAFAIIHTMCTDWNFDVLAEEALLNIGVDASVARMLFCSIGILLTVDICKYFKIDLIKKITDQHILCQYMVYLVMIFGILIFGFYGPGFDASQFIYSQF